MKRLSLLLAALACVLSACADNGTVTVAPDPRLVTPSRPPRIFSPTPLLIYPTGSVTPTFAAASQTPSLTLTSAPASTLTETPAPAWTSTWTPSPASAPLTIHLLGCDTSLDLAHGMGEVTNAYVVLANASGPDLTSVCATLSAADEGRVHPDKTVCAASLPAGFQATLKLTIDTTFRADTIVQVQVTSDQGVAASTGGQACTDIGLFKPAPALLGVVQPIP